MSITPDEVAAPAGHCTLFRSSPVRTFAAVFVILAVAYAAAGPLVDLIVGGDRDPWWSTVPQGVVLGALVAAGCAYTARSSISTWVRVSDGGVELAAQGSDPVFLTWPDIAEVAVRRTGLRTVLELTPVDLDRVHPVQEGGAGWPALTETGRGTAFTADLTQVWPGPRALRRALTLARRSAVRNGKSR